MQVDQDEHDAFHLEQDTFRSEQASDQRSSHPLCSDIDFILACLVSLNYDLMWLCFELLNSNNLYRMIDVHGLHGFEDRNLRYVNVGRNI